MLRALAQCRHTLLRAQHCDSTQWLCATVCVCIVCYSTQYCASTLWHRRTTVWHRRTTVWYRRTTLWHRRTTLWHWRATLRHRLFVTHTLKETQCCSARLCESVSHAVCVAKSLCHKKTQCCSATLYESVSQRDSVSLCASVSQRVCVTKRLSDALHLRVNMYTYSLSLRHKPPGGIPKGLCHSVWICIYIQRHRPFGIPKGSMSQRDSALLCTSVWVCVTKRLSVAVHLCVWMCITKGLCHKETQCWAY